MESKNKQEKETHHDEHIHEIEDEEEEDHTHNVNLKCRYYRKDFPEENDLVMVSDYQAYIHDLMII